MPAIHDYYGLLEVGEGADEAELKRAYRRLVRQLHPDATGGDSEAAERFRSVQAAYTVLTDPARRRAYDRARRRSLDMNDWSASLAEAQARDLDGQSFAVLFDLDADTPRDLELQVRLTFRQALMGGVTTARLPAGDTIKLPVPRGARHGQKIRIHGGAAGRRDLYVTFRVEPDTRYRREGDDLHVVETVSALDAMLGGTRSMTSVYGQVVRVPIPPGSQPGDRLRLRGQGVETATGRGDLYVELQVEVPRDLSEEQRAELAAAARRCGLLKDPPR